MHPERLGRIADGFNRLAEPVVFPPIRTAAVNGRRSCSASTFSCCRRSAISTSQRSRWQRDRHRLGRAAEGGVLVRRAVRDAPAEHRVGGHRGRGANRLVDDDPEALVKAVTTARMPEHRPQLYGDGKAAIQDR